MEKWHSAKEEYFHYTWSIAIYGTENETLLKICQK
jgi:hypothetical protein